MQNEAQYGFKMVDETNLLEPDPLIVNLATRENDLIRPMNPNDLLRPILKVTLVGPVRDEFHTSSPDAHDSEASVGMTAWAVEHDAIEVPGADPDSIDLDDIRWRDVRDYGIELPRL